jgi:hypothetical protein
MGGVGGHQVGIHDVTELLTAAAKTLNYETWDAVQFAEESRGAVPDQLVPGRIDDRDLTFEDPDERICPVTEPDTAAHRPEPSAPRRSQREQLVATGRAVGSRVLTRSFLRDGVVGEADEIMPSRVMSPESTAASRSSRAGASARRNTNDRQSWRTCRGNGARRS